MSQATITTRPVPGDTAELELTRERGRQAVNAFLETVHPLGGVPGWNACFGARYRDDLVAVLVLSRPTARHLPDDEIVEISRFGRREDRPANTGSWIIARGRTWAQLEGYGRMIAYAGVEGNTGTVYSAAGFSPVDLGEVDPSTWTHRDGREELDKYHRFRWEYPLEDRL